jgi:hypothetical protein
MLTLTTIQLMLVGYIGGLQHIYKLGICPRYFAIFFWFLEDKVVLSFGVIVTTVFFP